VARDQYSDARYAGILSGAFFLSSGSTPQIPKDHLLPQSPVVIAIAILVLVAASGTCFTKRLSDCDSDRLARIPKPRTLRV
jgi:hypothetical protein